MGTLDLLCEDCLVVFNILHTSEHRTCFSPQLSKALGFVRFLKSYPAFAGGISRDQQGSAATKTNCTSSERKHSSDCCLIWKPVRSTLMSSVRAELAGHTGKRHARFQHLFAEIPTRQAPTTPPPPPTHTHTHSKHSAPPIRKPFKSSI